MSCADSRPSTAVTSRWRSRTPRFRRSSRRSTCSPIRCGRSWRTEARGYGLGRASCSGHRRECGRQYRRDSRDYLEAVDQTVRVIRREEWIRRARAPGTEPELPGSDERLHAGRGLVVREPRQIELAPATVATKVAGNQERARRGRQPPDRRAEIEKIHRHELEDHERRGDVERGIRDDHVGPVDYPRHRAGGHQDVEGMKIAVTDDPPSVQPWTLLHQPVDPWRESGERATRDAVGELLEVPFEGEAARHEAVPGQVFQE